MIYGLGVVDAVVREWHEHLGWGVLDSNETPGGCWTHFSSVRTPVVCRDDRREVAAIKVLAPGQLVELDWEAARQDGFEFRAIAVRTF